MFDSFNIINMPKLYLYAVESLSMHSLWLTHDDAFVVKMRHCPMSCCANDANMAEICGISNIE